MRIKTDFLFTLALFCVFAGTALATVWIGANIYRSTAASMADHYDARTALAYVSEKIRQHDAEGSITVMDESTLRLRQRIDDTEYYTYVYLYEGMLRELMIASDQAFAPEDGTELFSVSEFTVTSLTDSLYRITTGTEHSRLELMVHSRSAA